VPRLEELASRYPRASPVLAQAVDDVEGELIGLVAERRKAWQGEVERAAEQARARMRPAADTMDAALGRLSAMAGRREWLGGLPSAAGVPATAPAPGRPDAPLRRAAPGRRIAIRSRTSSPRQQPSSKQAPHDGSVRRTPPQQWT
jgi:hypothetical protein